MKTQWQKHLTHITQTAMLVAVLAFGSVAWAQQRAQLTVTELQTLGKERTVRFKDGQVLTYQQLAEMTEVQKVAVREKAEKRSEWIEFREWELDTANARNAELDKTNAAAWQEYEKNAQKLEATVRTALASGLKLPSDYKRTFSFAIAHGKPLETVKYFESLLARPELFKN